MSHDRRSVLAAIGLALPFGIGSRTATAAPIGPAPVLQLRSFEEAVREAFGADSQQAALTDEGGPCHRIEIGYSEEVSIGVQGCHNDRPFAGYPAGHLQIVRTGSGAGPVVSGVRLYVTTVDVVLTGGYARSGRPLDFAALAPAPVLYTGAESSIKRPEDVPPRHRTGRAVQG